MLDEIGEVGDGVERFATQKHLHKSIKMQPNAELLNRRLVQIARRDVLHDHLLHRLVLKLLSRFYARIVLRELQIHHDEVGVLNAQLVLRGEIDRELLFEHLDLRAESFERVDIIERVRHLPFTLLSSLTSEFQCCPTDFFTSSSNPELFDGVFFSISSGMESFPSTTWLFSSIAISKMILHHTQLADAYSPTNVTRTIVSPA